MKNNLKISALILALCVLIITGCKNNTASLVGTWTFKTQRQIAKVNGTTTSDTTVNLPSGSTITFTSAGTYTTIGFTGTDTGTYTQNSGKLTITSPAQSTPMSMLINTLTDHNLALEQRDTSTTAPYETAQNIFNLTR